jgi:hypothetical protein
VKAGAKRTVAYHDNPWGVVVSLARASLSPTKALCELLDNAFDAGAKNVRVECMYYNGVHPSADDGSRLVVSDDGHGVPNLDALVGMGEHVAHDRAGSGIYGVGFKHAALRLGGEESRVEVTTHHGTQSLHASIDWLALQRRAPCMTVENVSLKKRTRAAPSGTSIEIKPLRVRLLQARETIAELIRYTYHPLLEHGDVRLEFVEPQTVRALMGEASFVINRGCQFPKLKEHVTHTLVFGKRKAHIRAGIMVDGSTTPYAGLTYVHGYRVVKKASRAGCGTGSIDRLFGVVTLEGDWLRATNKDDLVDADALYEAVSRKLADILKKADTEAHTLQMDRGLKALAADIEVLLPGIGSRARRGKKRGGESRTPGPGQGDAAGDRPNGSAHPPKADGDRGKAPALLVKPIRGWVKGMPIGRFDGKAVLDIYADHPMLGDPTGRGIAFFDRRAWFTAAVITLALHANETISDASVDVAGMLAKVTGGEALLDGLAPTTPDV